MSDSFNQEDFDNHNRSGHCYCRECEKFAEKQEEYYDGEEEGNQEAD